jgi:hypothetical protein
MSCWATSLTSSATSEDQVIVVLVPAGIQARQHPAGDLPGSGAGADLRPPAQVVQVRLYQLGE